MRLRSQASVENLSVKRLVMELRLNQTQHASYLFYPIGMKCQAASKSTLGRTREMATAW